jgi:hypothetical protein
MYAPLKIALVGYATQEQMVRRTISIMPDDRIKIFLGLVQLDWCQWRWMASSPRPPRSRLGAVEESLAASISG